MCLLAEVKQANVAFGYFSDLNN